MTETVTDRTAAPPAAGDVYVACARELLAHALPADELPPSALIQALTETRRQLARVLAFMDESRAFTAGQQATLREALADALAHQAAGAAADCAACDIHPAGLCDEHADRLDRVDSYQALARLLAVTT